jgi:hypothetical protein
MAEVAAFALSLKREKIGRNGITLSFVCNAIADKATFVSVDPNFFENLQLRMYLLGLIPLPER